MNKENLQTYMEENIPLMKNAGLIIEEINDDLVKISGLIADNKNHHNTVFGGSISVALILAGWIKVLHIMKQEDPESSIVICSQNTEYLKPVKGDFIGIATSPDSSTLGTFLKSYTSRGKGKLEIQAGLYEKGSEEICAEFKGTFFIKAPAEPEPAPI
jgi:thioesterase domain-containing protein